MSSTHKTQYIQDEIDNKIQGPQESIDNVDYIEPPIWRYLYFILKHVSFVLFFIMVYFSCLFNKFFILELAHIKPETSFMNSKNTSDPEILDFKFTNSPVLLTGFCILFSETISCLYCLISYIWESDDMKYEFSFSTLVRLIITEVFDVIGQLLFVMYVLPKSKINVSVFSMSTVMIIPILLKCCYYDSLNIKRYKNKRSIIGKTLCWLGLLINVVLIVLIFYLQLKHYSWDLALVNVISILLISQRFYWNYLPTLENIKQFYNVNGQDRSLNFGREENKEPEYPFTFKILETLFIDKYQVADHIIVVEISEFLRILL